MKELIGLLTAVTFILTFLYFFGLLWWRIFAKAGHNGALGLFMLIPFVNLIMLYVLAFREWPIQRELSHARRRLPPERRSIFDEG